LEVLQEELHQVNFNLLKWYRECNRNIIFSTSYNIGELILLFYGAILDSYQETLVALGGESCSSCQEPGSGSCVLVYQ
jgi:hypothetical protein